METLFGAPLPIRFSLGRSMQLMEVFSNLEGGSSDADLQ